MTNTTPITGPEVCRVCGAPSGSYVRRSNLNRAQWVASSAGAPASVFWSNAERVTLDHNGMCPNGKGCGQLHRHAGAR